MTGIGFVLRKLTRQDDLLGVIQGFAHSALASNGPWLLTILALGSLSVLTARLSSLEALLDFRLIVIYNFAFSLVLCGPVIMVVTRTLADLIYEKRVDGAPGMLVGALALVALVELPVAIAFYGWYAELSAATRVAAVSNFMLVSALWVVSVFLSALKDYRSISGAFAAGMAVAVAGGVGLAPFAGTAGMLTGFNAGLGVALFALVAKIVAEYPYPAREPFAFMRRFRPYWMLAASGLVYNAGIWVDKWVMWLSAGSERLPSGLVAHPHYDSAMFLAYLSITPAMALFMLTVETRFFEGYLQFFRDLQRHASYRRIDQNHGALIAILIDGVRNLVVIQGSITLVVILLAPTLFTWLGIDFLQLGMFRLGVLGSFFHVLVLVLLIVLAYFDFRGPVLVVQTTFLATNALFTLATLGMGFAWYGYGYFLAAVLTFLVGYAVTWQHLRELPYQTFVRYNKSVRVGRAAAQPRPAETG